MKDLRQAIVLLVVFLSIGLINAQSPVLIDQYVDVSRIDAAVLGGQEGIFLEPGSGNLAAGMVVNRDSLHAYVSLDGGATWTKTAFINASNDEVRNFTVSGDANQPIFVFSKRGDTPTGPPWARHLAYIAVDDFGWGGGSYSLTPVAIAGTDTNVLDIYYPQFDMSPFDGNLRGVIGHHGSSQAGGEYQQFFHSFDGGLTWSDRIKIISSADQDSLKPYYVDNLTSHTPDLHYGPNGTIVVSGPAEINTVTHNYYRLWYTMSTDSGQTWNGVSVVPGAEELELDRSEADRVHKVFLDTNNNFHIFALLMDTTGVWAAYDFKLVGTTWTVNRFVEPVLLDDGLVDIEDKGFGDDSPLSAPTLNSDGTIFYSFIDVVDTTGGNNDYRLFTVYSQDNGATWSDRFELVNLPDEIDGIDEEQITDVARNADSNLHITYTGTDTSGGVTTYSQYYLKVPTSQIVSIGNSNKPIVGEGFMLHQNYPNPFNPSTTIRFNLARKSQVSLIIYNTLGEEVAVLLDNESLKTGEKEIVWDASNLASGIYFYRLNNSAGISQIKKMVLLK